MRLRRYSFLGIVLMIPFFVQARPVSYPGGWTVMQMNDGEKNIAHIHYSPTAKTSVGYKFEYWRDRDMTVNAVQVNHLLRRWNRPDSQANLYLKSGIGVANSDGLAADSKTSLAGFMGIATDWEDRRHFVSYANRYTWVDEVDAFFQQSFRLGWAPYEGDYGDLHTWLMLQVEHSPESDNQLTLTPLVRLFKDVHLLEAGMSNRRELVFNYIFRY